MTRLIELVIILVACAIIGNNLTTNNDYIVQSTSLEKNESFFIPDTTSIKNIVQYEKCIQFKSFEEFLHKLATRESSGDWTVINRFGYMGKYQLGKIALKDIGMDSITVEKFRNDSTVFPEHIQEIAVRKLIKNNRKYLKKYIKSYRNTTINGILITESSILAAAHLVGASQVKEWLNCDGLITKVDGNGTTIESYLKLFSGYKIT